MTCPRALPSDSSRCCWTPQGSGGAAEARGHGSRAGSRAGSQSRRLAAPAPDAAAGAARYCPAAGCIAGALLRTCGFRAKCCTVRSALCRWTPADWPVPNVRHPLQRRRRRSSRGSRPRAARGWASTRTTRTSTTRTCPAAAWTAWWSTAAAAPPCETRSSWIARWANHLCLASLWALVLFTSA